MNALRALATTATCGLALWLIGAGLSEADASSGPATADLSPGVCSDEGLLGSHVPRGMLEHCLRGGDLSVTPPAAPHPPHLECPDEKLHGNSTASTGDVAGSPGSRQGPLTL